MTAINKLGTTPFRVNVYQDEDGLRYGLCFWEVGPLESSAIYRLRITPWIPHDGGPCPVPQNVRARYWFRNGIKLLGDIGESQDMYWRHDGKSSDIIAYQICEDNEKSS